VLLFWPLNGHCGRRLDSQLTCIDVLPDGNDEIGEFSWGHLSKRSDRPTGHRDVI
jgi:hypothetical protein